MHLLALCSLNSDTIITSLIRVPKTKQWENWRARLRMGWCFYQTLNFGISTALLSLATHLEQELLQLPVSAFKAHVPLLPLCD